LGLRLGPQDDHASLGAMHRALELGVNWIDTAAVYGLGHSEQVVGRLLRDLPADERPFVFTKCGLLTWPGVTGAIVGARSPQQVEGWIGAASLELSVADLDEITAAIERTGAGMGPARPAALQGSSTK
jgi:aryl-alcohol dehydrogenase-like predicted oxidoreductase